MATSFNEIKQGFGYEGDDACLYANAPSSGSSFDFLKDAIGMRYKKAKLSLNLQNGRSIDSEIQQQLKITALRVEEIKRQLKEDLSVEELENESRTRDVHENRPENNNDLVNQQIGLKNIYTQQLSILEKKVVLLEQELRESILSYTQKIQWLEDQNQLLLDNLQNSSQEIAQIRQSEEVHQRELAETCGDASKQLSQMSQQIEYLGRQKGKYKKSRVELKNQLECIQAENGILDKINSNLKGENQVMKHSLEEKSMEIERLHQQLNMVIEKSEEKQRKLNDKCDGLTQKINELESLKDEEGVLIQQCRLRFEAIQQEQNQLQERHILLKAEKEAIELSGNEKIATLESTFDIIRVDATKVKQERDKVKRKLDELKKIEEKKTKMIENFEHFQSITRGDIFAITTILEKDLNSFKVIPPYCKSEISQEADLAKLVTHLRNLASSVKKEMKSRESVIEAKSKEIILFSQENLLLKSELEKTIANEMNKERLKEEVNQELRTQLNFQRIKNEDLTKQIVEQQINFNNFQQTTNESYFHNLTIQLLGYCAHLHQKVAHLKFIKLITSYLADAYLQGSQFIISLRNKDLKNTLNFDEKKKLRIRKLKVICKCIKFITMLKNKRQTPRFLLSQGIITSWLSYASKKPFKQINVGDSIFKNPQQLISSLNATSNSLDINEVNISLCVDLKLQIKSFEATRNKNSQEDKEQISFFHQKMIEFAEQSKEIMEKHQKLEQLMDHQLYVNKQQALTIERLHGELSDLIFQIKLLTRSKGSPDSFQKRIESIRFS